MTQDMRKIELIKTRKENGKFVYTAIDGHKVIYTSAPTHREYIAILISSNGSAINRFGRVDLIGKGDSKVDFYSHAHPFLAVVQEFINLVSIPAKVEFKTFYFRAPNGRQLHAIAESESEARESIRRKKRYFNIPESYAHRAKLVSQNLITA